MQTPRFFNTAGPINTAMHYTIPPLSRWDMVELQTLIDQQKYFILHAPRQSGKTSGLLALREYLNKEGRYHCLYINVEVGQSARENVTQAIGAILSQLRTRAKETLGDPRIEALVKKLDLHTEAHDALHGILSEWCSLLDKPLVLLIDEIDSLVGDSLISVLRQLRAGYDKRPQNFPSSVILCGVRDVRDYRIHSSSNKDPITGGSAFNIKSESLSVGNFTSVEIKTLLLEHTKETGQVFEEPVHPLFWEYTRGQPWLVNALAYEACFRMTEGKDRTHPITAEIISKAKENLILRRDTHLDQLVDKLKEDRIRRVIQPILSGDSEVQEGMEDDAQYAIDLGLITRVKGGVEISNSIYKEIIPRTLTLETQYKIAQEQAWYIKDDGSLDVPKLLAAFQQFFRENIEHWIKHFQYPEAGPQLLLQAFLQRVINGGGRIEREYGLGRGRVDLYIYWPPTDQKIVIECKILKTLAKTLKDGITQTAQYGEACGASELHLIVFDRTSKKPWSKKIWKKRVTHKGQKVQIWGM